MEKIKIRQAVVAGQFYPLTSQALRKQIEGFLDKKSEKIDAIGCMLPHAGYMYSGKVAVETISQINLKENVILLGPNHTGYGSQFSIMTQGAWQTPMGQLNINSRVAKKILERCKYLEDDSVAHAYEHSLEVELPILQYFKNDFLITPIVVFPENLAILKEIGKDIANTVKESGLQSSTIIIASSDMTHYEPQKQAEEKDQEAINAIIELDEDKLMKKIQELNISMCGFAPVIVMLSAAKLLGAKRAKLVKYQTSGDVSGEKDSVVGYAGIIVY